MTKFKNISFMFAVTAAMMFIYNCQESQPKVLTGVATFVKGKVFLNGSKMSVGSKVQAKDVIKVSKKSGAIVQFSTGALVTLKSKTQLEVSKLLYGKDGVPVVNLSQTKGSTFSKIRTNQAKYSIKTPTAVAGVRGTSFGVTVKKGKQTEISLLKGKVAVTSTRAVKKDATEPAPHMLQAGEKIAISESKGVAKKAEKLSEAETKSLKTYNETKFLAKEDINQEASVIKEKVKAAPVVETKVIEKVIQEKMVIAAEKETKADKAVKKAAKKLTLDDLRAKYGKLTKIITHDKQAYVGGDWKQVGDYHFIRTTKGKKKIKTSKVFKVLPMD